MVWFWGGQIAVEGSGHADGFVGSDRVLDPLVGVDLVCESEAVSDFAAVEIFVFDDSEEARGGSGPTVPLVA